MHKILIIAPSWIGDMVMAEPLLRLLKQSANIAEPIDDIATAVGKFFIAITTNCGPQLLPPTEQDHTNTKNNDVTIDVVAPNYLAPLLERIPHINHIWKTSFEHGALDLKERWQLAKQLRRQNYAQSIILPNSFKSALIPWLARIPLRTGWRGEMRYLLLNDMHILDKQLLPLMVQRFTALGSARAEKNPASLSGNHHQISSLPLELVPQLSISFETVNATVHKLGLSASIAAKPILALCIGAEYGETKRWPAAYFAEVARKKFQEGWEIWLLGSSKDAAIATAVQQASSYICRDLVGKTTLAEVTDLLSLAKAAITNDSGLMHIAAALNTPMVAIYGSSSPAFTPPLTSNLQHARILSLNLPCSPCFKRHCPLGHFKCMLQLQPNLVLAALEDI